MASAKVNKFRELDDGFSIVYELTEEEKVALLDLATKLQNEYNSAEEIEFLKVAKSFIQENEVLQNSGMMDFMRHMLKYKTNWGVLRGLPIAEDTLRSTPKDWGEALPHNSIADFILMIVSTQLGYPFGMATEQNGRTINDVIPAEDAIYTDTSGSSMVPMGLHCEQSFHPLRPDFLAMLCVRNPNKVATLVAPVNDPNIEMKDQKSWDYLMDYNYHILPAECHGSLGSDGFERIQVVYEVDGLKRIRSDWTLVDFSCKEAEIALQDLKQGMEGITRRVAHGTGDMLVISNHLALHGREMFPCAPDYSEKRKARWLKRTLLGHADFVPKYIEHASPKHGGNPHVLDPMPSFHDCQYLQCKQQQQAQL